MKLPTIFSALAGSTAIALLLGTSLAWAEEVCVDGDTVMGIKNLEVLTDQYGTVNINVDFRYATGYEVYGSGLDNFPFDLENAEEDAFATMLQINEALEGENPIPGSAGQPGQDSYFIGVEAETELGESLIAATGSENLTGGFWDPCTGGGCIAGVAVLEADQHWTYADLSRADGSSCGNAPPVDPPPAGSFDIVPCITGSWYLPARDGEGYNIEIIGSELDPDLLAYFYTYDDAGNQMWLTGVGDVDGDTAVVPVVVTSGPSYGDDYDPNDVVRDSWGTLTFKFTSKDTGTVKRDSTMGFGDTTVDIVRLTSATGLKCP
jgi:hypothetical protein